MTKWAQQCYQFYHNMLINPYERCYQLQTWIKILERLTDRTLIPAMCNHTSCVQVNELPQSHCGDNQESILFFMVAYVLCPSCLCEIWVPCVSWITYDHLHCTPCLACWSLLGSLVTAICNQTSCAQVHELPQSQCGDSH